MFRPLHAYITVAQVCLQKVGLSLKSGIRFKWKGRNPPVLILLESSRKCLFALTFARLKHIFWCVSRKAAEHWSLPPALQRKFILMWWFWTICGMQSSSTSKFEELFLAAVTMSIYTVCLFIVLGTPARHDLSKSKKAGFISCSIAIINWGNGVSTILHNGTTPLWQPVEDFLTLSVKCCVPA